MTGDARVAQKLITDVRKLAASTPFTSEELFKTSRSLLVNVKPEDQIKTLRMLGDVASAVKTPLNELATVYNQVLSKGRLQGDEMMQFMERGIPLGKELAKMLGVSTMELAELQKEGAVTGEIVSQAFRNMTAEGGMFYQSMEKQSQTMAGMWSTFTDNMQLQFIAVFEMVSPALKEVLVQLQDSTEEVGRTSTAMESLGEITQMFTQYLKENPQIIREIVGLVSDLVDEGMSQLVIEARKFLGYLKENPQYLQELVTSTRELIGNIGEAVKGLGEFLGMVKDILGVANQIGEALNAAGEFARNAALATRHMLGQNDDNAGSWIDNIFSRGGAQNAGKYSVTSPVVGQGRSVNVDRYDQLQKHHDYQRRGNNEVFDMTLSRGGKTNVPVPSAVSGKVHSTGFQPGGAGNWVNVIDEAGNIVKFFHLASIAVKKGQSVLRGQSVGIQGTTGSSTGVHLHMEAPKNVVQAYINSLETGNWGGAAPGGGTGGGASNTGMSPGQNRQRFLAAIRHGESGGNYNAVNPSSGARGAYQFMPATRASIKNRTGFDAYGSKDQQDGAALKLIEIYSKEIGQNIMALIDAGNFKAASQLLGQNQYVSLPHTGANAHQVSPKWKGKNINNFGGAPVNKITTSKTHDDHAGHNHGTSPQAKSDIATITSFKGEEDKKEKAKAQAQVKKAQDKAKKARERAAREKTKQAEAEARQAEQELIAYENFRDKVIGGNSNIRGLQKELERMSAPQGDELAQALLAVNDKFDSYQQRITESIIEQTRLLETATDPASKSELKGNIGSLKATMEASESARQQALATVGREEMLRQTAAAEEKLAKERAAALQAEREWNDAVIRHAEEMRAYRERFAEAIARAVAKRQEAEDNMVSDQLTIAASNQSVVDAKASQATGDKQVMLQRESGLMGIQQDTTARLLQLEQLSRTGRLAASRIEALKNNILETANIDISNLTKQYQTLGQVVTAEVGQAIGNTLQNLITGSETLGQSLSNLAANLAGIFAQKGIEMLIGSIFPTGGNMFGGLLNFAGGGSIGDTEKKERRQSGGRQPQLAMLNKDELVLSAEQAQVYKRTMGMKNFADGSPQLARTAMPSYQMQNQGTNINIPITVEGGGKSSMDTPSFRKEIENAVTGVILKHKTQSGGLLR
jgi:tape measure domain-containing protein